MKKEYSYRKLSNKRCIDCGKPLKANLVHKNPNANRCYCCYNISIGRTITTRNKYVNGGIVNIRNIDFKQVQRNNRIRYKFNRNHGNRTINRETIH